MCWLQPLSNSNFEKRYEIAKSYFDKHGNLDVPTSYQHENGFWLGAWINKIRNKKDQLTESEIKKLDEIEMLWQKLNPWEKKFLQAKEYAKNHGILPFEPKQCTTDEEKKLCQWLRRHLLRKNYGSMSQEQIDKLTSIGMDWMNSIERSFYTGLQHSIIYKKEHNHLDVPVAYKSDDGYPLVEWLHGQRTHRKRLSKEKIKQLVELEAKGFEDSEL